MLFIHPEWCVVLMEKNDDLLFPSTLLLEWGVSGWGRGGVLGRNVKLVRRKKNFKI